MWYLYLDESGDLGFDFANKRSSIFFTITILLVKGIQAADMFSWGVFRKYERGDVEWFEKFGGNIQHDKTYP